MELLQPWPQNFMFVKIATQPKKKEIAPFSNRNKIPKKIAKTVLRRKSIIADAKQHTMLMAHNVKRRIPEGLEWLANVNAPNNNADGTNAKGSASTEGFFFLSGSFGLD
jgi:hypothetical protein